MLEESADNLVFTTTTLGAGCAVGFLFSLGIAYGFHLHTYEPTLVTAPSWITSSTTWDSESSEEDVWRNKYAVYGVAVMAIGCLLCPTILLAVVVWRRIKGEDILSEDKLGIGIVALGFLCGILIGIGSYYGFGWSTRGHTQLGWFLLILVPFMAIVIGLLLLCYKHHKETGSYYGLGF